jgi:SRSO17 transposase
VPLALRLFLPEEWTRDPARCSGERKYHLTTHPEGTSLRALAAAIKARWVCEQAHQQLKEELGLDHYEGRSWAGLHHHALLTQIAFAFLQHLRLRDASVALRRRGEKAGTTRRATAYADAPDRTTAHRAVPARRRTPLPDVPRTAHLRAAQTRLGEAQ